MSTVAVCIPWRTDFGWRETVFDYVLARWQETDYQICVGTDLEADLPSPLNVSRLLNNARQQTRADVLVVASADHIPDPLAVSRAALAAAEHGWSPIFTATAGVSMRATLAMISGRSLDPARYVTSEAPFCTALLAVRADVWDEIDGWDERFHGWGCEDTAFRLVLDTLYPSPPAPSPARTYALWHEAASRDRFEANVELLGEYLACGEDHDALRALIRRRYLT